MKTLFSSISGHKWGVVDTPLAVTMLTTPDATRFIGPFLGQRCTAGRAARQLGVRVDTMLYRIERMKEAGLVRQVEAATPRSRKEYETVQERFVVPFEATQFETLVEMVLRHNAGPHQQFAQALVAAIRGEQGGWMVRIHRDGKEAVGRYVVDAAPQGQLDWQMTEMLAPDAPATWYTTHDLRLEQKDAKALQHDLLAVWQRYRTLSLPAETLKVSQRHILHLYLAPVAPEESS